MNQNTSLRLGVIGSAAVVSLSMASQVGAVELSVKADAHRALIVEGSPTTVTVTVSGKADEQGKYQLHQQVVNRYGGVAELTVIEIELKDQWQQKVDVPVEYYGPTTYKAWVVKDGEGQVIAR